MPDLGVGPADSTGNDVTVAYGPLPSTSLWLSPGAQLWSPVGPIPAPPNPVVAAPGTATLTTNGQAPTALAPRTVTPTTAALVTAAFAPTALAPRVVVPSTAATTTAATAPTVRVDVTPTPTTRALVLAGAAPTVLTPRVVIPTTAALATSSPSPTVLTPRVVVPGTTASTTTLQAPTVAAPRVVATSTTALVLSTSSPDIIVGVGDVVAIPPTRALVLTTTRPAALEPQRLRLPSSTVRATLAARVSFTLPRMLPVVVVNEVEMLRFSAKDPEEVELYGFNFAKRLNSGETIVGATFDVFNIGTEPGSRTSDDSAMALSGAPDISLAPEVRQVVVAGVAGHTYRLRAVVTTSTGRVLVGSALILVLDGGAGADA